MVWTSEILCVCQGGCERRRAAGRLWFGRLRFCVSVKVVVSVGALLDTGRWCRNLEMGFCGVVVGCVVCFVYLIRSGHLFGFFSASMSEAFFKNIYKNCIQGF